MHLFGIDMRIRNWAGTRLADILSPNSWRLWESYPLLRRSGWSGQVRIYIIYGHGIDLVIKEYSGINSGRIKTFKAEYYQSRVIFCVKQSSSCCCCTWPQSSHLIRLYWHYQQIDEWHIGGCQGSLLLTSAVLECFVCGVALAEAVQ